MDEPLEKNFIQEMRDVLRKQLSDAELTEKKQQHDVKIVADEGARRWHELKDSLKSHVEEINEGLVEPLLSYSDNASGNEFSLRNELNDRSIQIAFEPASAVISFKGNKGKGAFLPHVVEDALEYGWEDTSPCDAAKPLRRFRSADDERPTVTTKWMSEILIRCVVLEPVS